MVSTCFFWTWVFVALKNEFFGIFFWKNRNAGVGEQKKKCMVSRLIPRIKWGKEIALV